MHSIKDMVAGGKRVKLVHYCLEELWYVTECGFEFPVPIEECGSAKWLPEDKAILFMRFIRKQLQFIDAARAEQLA